MARGRRGRVGSDVRELPSRTAEPVDREPWGSDGPAVDRVKLFKLIWDALGSEFGGRHELYERNYSGNNEQIRLDIVNFARGRGLLAASDALVARCLADYDLDGWTGAPWRTDGGTDSPQRRRGRAEHAEGNEARA